MKEKQTKLGLLIAVFALAALLAVPAIAKKKSGKSMTKTFSGNEKIQQVQDRGAGTKQKKNLHTLNEVKALIGERSGGSVKERDNRREAEIIQAIQNRE